MYDIYDNATQLARWSFYLRAWDVHIVSRQMQMGDVQKSGGSAQSAYTVCRKSDFYAEKTCYIGGYASLSPGHPSSANIIINNNMIKLQLP